MPERDRDKSVEQWLRQTPVPGARVDDCLDAETLAAWSEGLLDGPARSTAEAHAASCARCQAMLAIMVRTTPAPAGATGSPFRKWLMMLSPAMAAAAAVALWVAVGQRPASPAIDELTKRQAKSERAAEASQAAPALVGAEKESDRKAPAAPLDRDAPQVTADARAEFRGRTRDGASPDTGATAPANERTEKKDVASARRADKSRDAELRAAAEPAAPPPPAAPTPAPPAARPSAAEGVTASAARPPVTVAPPGPPPLQQVNQVPNQAPNANQAPGQAQNQGQLQPQSQNQAGQRQQAGGVEERVIVSGEATAARTVGDSVARGGSGGRGGAASGFADAPASKMLANAGPLDIAVPESPIRWRIADGRTDSAFARRGSDVDESSRR